MARHFVVVLPDLTAEQEQSVSQYLAPPIGWWHHVKGVWLVVDSAGNLTPVLLREGLQKIVPFKEMAILQVTPEDWAARLHNEKLEPSNDWFAKFWPYSLT